MSSSDKPNVEKVKEMCRKSLWFLATEILGYKDWDLIHDDLEKMLNKPAKRKLILIPRGHLKTAIGTKAYAIQRILKNPNIRILIANQVWDKSREMLFEIKEFMTGKSVLPSLFGNFESQRWRDEEIIVRQRTQALSSPTISTTGVEADITSAHFDLIILDDLMGAQNSQTKEQRDKVKRFYRFCTALLDPPNPKTGEGGEMVVIGTRYHHDDLYQEIIDHEADYFDIMIRQVVEDGKILFPKKFNMRFDGNIKSWIQTDVPTMDYVNFLRDSMGIDFSTQYMNEPVDSDTQIIKREYFKYYRKRPDNLYIVTTVDPALSMETRSDYTAIVTCGMDDKRNIYVLDTMRGKWDSPADIITAILESVDKWKPHQLGIEENAFQKSLRYWLEELTLKKRSIPPIYPLKAPVTKSKLYRLKSMEPYYRNGMVYHHETHKGKEMENELLCLTADGYMGKHDDLIDALSWQLELLSAGATERPQEIPVGSWAWEEMVARKSINNFRSFFKD
jgi:predicted phage terminase large subunit-like protein